MGKKDIRTVEEFDQLVNNNKTSGKHWYHNFKDKWWRGMSEEVARMYVTKLEEEEKALVNKIVLVSTWNINCGIATYTRYLLEDLNRIMPNSFWINPINEGILEHKIKGVLTHLQHEHGIVPTLPKIKGKMIVTWHTVSKRTDIAIKEYESNYDVVAHIVHSECSRGSLDSSRDVWTVPHGSMLIPEMKKEDARRLLGININMPIGFVFGFQSGDKNYQRLIDVAKSTDTHIIISGAPHNIARSIAIENDKNVTFINRFLTENEVNLYALASDILLFDYVGKEHYSVSGAMHRIIGAGRPVICSDVRHFSDIRNEDECLKFRNHDKLEECIRRALEYPDSERLSIAARKYAEKMSWEKIAKKHIEVYKKYTDISSLDM